MPQYIAFLRAINVGGRNIKMAELRHHFAALKFKNIETFIASGNVIFESDETNSTLLETTIEAHLATALGYVVDTYIRTPQDISNILLTPTPRRLKTATAAAFSIGFLKHPLNQQQQKTLLSLENDTDTFHSHKREVFWSCSVKQSDSKFSNAVFEKQLNISATFRGINTVKRLAAKYPA